MGLAEYVAEGDDCEGGVVDEELETFAPVGDGIVSAETTAGDIESADPGRTYCDGEDDNEDKG